MPGLLSLLFFALSACQPPQICLDLDLDGYCPPDDCDDAVATTYPAAPESCDGVDNDCDNEVDEITQGTWYLDGDADGWGDATHTWTDCSVPVGYVETPGDCDDGNAAVHPDAQEVCDGVDNDCNGQSDEVDSVTWYRDLDDDGWGDTEDSEVSCTPPEGHVLQAGDCDEADPSVHPGADDACGDGLDANCDGVDPSCTVLFESMSLSSAHFKATGENSGDRAGNELIFGDVNGDGVDDLWVSAREHTGPYTYNGAVYLIHGPASGTMALADANAILYGSESENEVGRSVSMADLDRDGLMDVLAGSPDGPDGGTGALFGMLGPVTGTTMSKEADIQWYGVGMDENTAHGSVGGDFDGDGFVDDVAACAYNSDIAGIDVGAAYVVYDMEPGVHSFTEADATLLGDPRGAWAGEFMYAGDVTGDGIADLFVTATYNPYGPPQAGVVYVVESPVRGTFSLESPLAVVVGEQSGACAGTSVSGGDIDGDGMGDMLVGAYGQDSGAGAAYVVLGPVSGDVDLAAADVQLSGASGGDYAGWSVATADANHDGFGDVAVGAMTDSSGRRSGGAVYFLYGPLEGSASLSEHDARFTGEGSNDYAGSSVNFGDFNGDGLGDLATGAEYQTTSRVQAGAAYVIFGGL